MHCNAPHKSAERRKWQKNINWWARQLLSHTQGKCLYMQSV